MRLPFLQMESDLLGHGAPTVATLAGCSPVQAVGHVAMLRAWAVSAGPDDVAPDGWVRGPDAGALIEGAAQWQGEPGRLLRALRVAKLIIQDGDSFQVVGMEPYQRAWAENQKARERMANKRGGSRNKPERSAKFGERSANTPERSAKFDRAGGERSAKFGGQTQTQTQTQTQIEDEIPPPPQGRGGATTSVRAPEKPPAATRPPEGPSVDLHAALSAEHARFEDGREMPWSMGNERVHQRLLTLAQKSGVPPAEWVGEVVRRYRHMRTRAGMQYEPGKFKGTTLEELAKPECWGGNAKPPAAEQKSGSQAPTMGSWDWDKGLPPIDPDLLNRPEPF